MATTAATKEFISAEATNDFGAFAGARLFRGKNKTPLIALGFCTRIAGSKKEAFFHLKDTSAMLCNPFQLRQVLEQGYKLLKYIESEQPKLLEVKQ
jgi:hypothetical protein